MMRMGVGGLLKEIDTRPMPREKAPATPQTGIAPRSAPTIAAVVLAAGRSRRMAPHNKLLVADRTGKAMIARVVDNVLSSNARPILVVTGHQVEQVQHALGGRPVRFVHAADYAEGLSASLKAGIAAVPRGLRGRAGLPGRYAAGDRADDRPAAVALRSGRGTADRAADVPRQAGQPDAVGPAVLPEILQITGDSGARFLLAKHMEAVVEVEMADDAVLRDFDTTESLATLPQRLRPEPIG